MIDSVRGATAGGRRGLLSLIVLAGALSVLPGCATTGANPRDPLEPMNRAVFSFNEKADTYVVRPVAVIYDMAPTPVKTGVSNFFGNLGDLWIGVNSLLQGKPADALSDWTRFVVNSTLGVAGLMDVASDIGLDKHDEDFGQTLGVWGVGTGPYLVLPIFGPSDLRDGVGLAADLSVDPINRLQDPGGRNGAALVRLTNARAQLLGTDTAAKEASLDQYVYLREFYLQRRRNQIYDGNPPRVKEDLDEDEDGGADEPADADKAPEQGKAPAGETAAPDAKDAPAGAAPQPAPGEPASGPKHGAQAPAEPVNPPAATPVDLAPAASGAGDDSNEKGNPQ